MVNPNCRQEGAYGLGNAGCNSVQGGRPYNEDTHLSDNTFIPVGDSAFFQLHCVFDGHGGASVAEYCAAHMPGTLRALMRKTVDFAALSSADRLTRGSDDIVSIIETCVEQAVVDTNAQLQATTLLQQQFQWMGSTAVLCLLYKQHVWVANAGKLHIKLFSCSFNAPGTSSGFAQKQCSAHSPVTLLFDHGRWALAHTVSRPRPATKPHTPSSTLWAHCHSSERSVSGASRCPSLAPKSTRTRPALCAKV
jgi:hypothetical protein